ARSARGRARVDAQGRCNGVGSEEIGSPEPSRSPRFGRGRAVCFPPRAKQESQHFFGETPERRLWATKREARPAAFAGRSKLLPRLFGILPAPTQVSILSRSFPSRCNRKRIRLTIALETTLRRSKETNVTRYSVFPVLEPQHGVVSVADHDHVARCQ